MLKGGFGYFKLQESYERFERALLPVNDIKFVHGGLTLLNISVFCSTSCCLVVEGIPDRSFGLLCAQHVSHK